MQDKGQHAPTRRHGGVWGLQKLGKIWSPVPPQWVWFSEINPTFFPVRSWEAPVLLCWSSNGDLDCIMLKACGLVGELRRFFISFYPFPSCIVLPFPYYSRWYLLLLGGNEGPAQWNKNVQLLFWHIGRIFLRYVSKSRKNMAYNSADSKCNYRNERKPFCSLRNFSPTTQILNACCTIGELKFLRKSCKNFFSWWKKY